MEQYVELFVSGFSFGFAVLLYVGFIPAVLYAVWGILDSVK